MLNQDQINAIVSKALQDALAAQITEPPPAPALQYIECYTRNRYLVEAVVKYCVGDMYSIHEDGDNISFAVNQEGYDDIWRILDQPSLVASVFLDEVVEETDTSRHILAARGERFVVVGKQTFAAMKFSGDLPVAVHARVKVTPDDCVVVTPQPQTMKVTETECYVTPITALRNQAVTITTVDGETVSGWGLSRNPHNSDMWTLAGTGGSVTFPEARIASGPTFLPGTGYEIVLQ